RHAHDSAGIRDAPAGAAGLLGGPSHHPPRHGAGDRGIEDGRAGAARWPVSDRVSRRSEDSSARSVREVTPCEQPARMPTVAGRIHAASKTAAPAVNGARGLDGEGAETSSTAGSGSRAVGNSARIRPSAEVLLTIRRTRAAFRNNGQHAAL